MTKNPFRIFCLSFVSANVKHHPGRSAATPPKEGNTSWKAVQKQKQGEKYEKVQLSKCKVQLRRAKKQKRIRQASIELCNLHFANLRRRRKRGRQVLRGQRSRLVVGGRERADLDDHYEKWLSHFRTLCLRVRLVAGTGMRKQYSGRLHPDINRNCIFIGE
jgi:hypothetical protein